MGDAPNSHEAGDSYVTATNRLMALVRTGLLDSGADPSFDRLARLAGKKVI